MKKQLLKNWEISLLLALCITLCAGTWAGARSEALSAGLIRLHIVAASDEAAEQELKLRVRDSVLAYLEPRLQIGQDAVPHAELQLLLRRLVRGRHDVQADEPGRERLAARPGPGPGAERDAEGEQEGNFPVFEQLFFHGYVPPGLLCPGAAAPQTSRALKSKKRPKGRFFVFSGAASSRRGSRPRA